MKEDKSTISDAELARLTDYLSGEVVPGDGEEVALWFESSENKEMARLLAKSWEITSSPVRPAANIGEWERVVMGRIKSNEGNARRLLSGNLRRWLGYTGLAIALSFVSWQAFLWRMTTTTAPQQTYTTYATNSGQRAAVTLRDGSRVTLGPATTLRILATNTATNVVVAGEVLFNVNHASQRPFTVSAYGVTTRVLGTEFVVRSYDSSFVRVAVRDGRVSVQPPSVGSSHASVVTAGEAASVRINELPKVTPISDLATEFSWATGELVFRDMPLSEAIPRLSRWYNVEFRVTDPSLLKYRINGAFPKELTSSDMQNLGQVMGASVTRSGNIITFSLKQ